MDPQPNENPSSPTESAPQRESRSRLWPKILFGILLFLVLLWIATPFVLSMDWVRAKVEKDASAKLGVPVTLASHDFGWFSGLTLEGLEVANPPGYSTQPAFALERLEGDISAWRLLLGKVDLAGNVEGLQVRLEQRSDGSSNFGEIFNKPKSTEPPQGGEPTGNDTSDQDGLDLSKLQLDVVLHDGLVEVLQDGQLVESITNLSVIAKKAFGGNSLTLNLGADLKRPDGGTPGRIDLEVDADAAMETPAVVDLVAKDLDLFRYQPLLSSMLAPGALTHLQGVLSGALQATVSGKDRVELQGELTVAQPRVAGNLVGGLDLKSESWRLRPAAKVELPTGKAPIANVAGFLLDLGFARVEGMTNERTHGLLNSTDPAVGLAFEVDIDSILAMSRGEQQLLPEGLSARGGSLKGNVAMPVRDELPATLEAVLAGLRGAIDLQIENVTYDSWSLAGFAAAASIDQGKLSLDTAPSTRLNDGAVGIHLTADLREALVPTSLDLKLDGVAVRGSGVGVLQYFLPLLAGATDAANLKFDGSVNVEGTLQGPAMMNGKHWLEWANHWTGKGDLGMGAASFTPAPAVQSLLSATGQGERLEMKGFSTKYSISNGAVATNLGKLSKLSGDIGLEGTVSLAGAIDYKIDFTQWMAGHRDGKRILAVLGDTRLAAGLNGTLTAPKLAMPDMTQLLLQAGQKALEGELKGKVDDALQKGVGGVLDKIFGGKKKKQ